MESDDNATTPALRVSAMGARGLLLDPGGAVFDDAVQHRIQAMAAALRGAPGVIEAVPGMNNLLIEIDPAQLSREAAEARLRRLWAGTPAERPEGRTIEIRVVYGGAGAEDFDAWVASTGLGAPEAVARHAACRFEVAAPGAMPGFAYLSGLDPALAMPRRKVPHPRVPKGAVMIGGAQAAVMPITAPSGWHVIGMTDIALFDPAADPPCRLAPGDAVRFVPIEAVP